MRQFLLSLLLPILTGFITIAILQNAESNNEYFVKQRPNEEGVVLFYPMVKEKQSHELTRSLYYLSEDNGKVYTSTQAYGAVTNIDSALKIIKQYKLQLEIKKSLDSIENNLIHNQNEKTKMIRIYD